MPEVVEPDRREARPGGPTGRTLADSVGVERLPILPAEDELMILIRLAQGQAFLELAAAVPSQHLHGLGVEGNG